MYMFYVQVPSNVPVEASHWDIEREQLWEFGSILALWDLGT